MDDLHFFQKLINNFKGARKTLPSTRKTKFELDLMHSKLMGRNAMSGGINVQSAHMSNSLNSDLSLLTSTSDSTSFNASGNKLEISKRKTQNAANCNEHSKVLSESTYGKTKSSAMSSQTKTNSVENGRKIYGKRSLLHSDFRNDFSNKVFIQSFPPPCYGNITKNKDFSNTRKGYSCARAVNYEIPEFPESILHLAESNKKGVPNTLKNDIDNRKEFSTIIRINNVYPHHSRRKQARPLKSVRVSEKENEIPNTTNGIIVLENSQKYKIERSKTEDKYLPNKMHLPRILIKRNDEGLWSQNYMPSNDIKQMRVNNISNTGLVQYEFLKSRQSDLTNILEAEPTFVHSSSAYCKSYKHAFPSTNQMSHRPLLYKPFQTASNKEFDAKQEKFILLQPITQKRHKLAGKKIAHIASGKITKPSVSNQRQFKLENVTNNFGHNGSLAVYQAQQRTTCSTENPNASSIAPLILMFPKVSCVPKSVPVTLAPDCGIRSSNGIKECVDEQGTTHEKTTSDDRAGTCKVKRTKFVLMKIFELLLNISETLSSEFECPAGLEIALPIWKSELDRCIMSIEKIQSIISEKEKTGKTHDFHCNATQFYNNFNDKTM